MPQTKIIFNLIRKIEFRQSRWHRRWGGRSSCRKWPPARLTSSTETATDLRLSRPRHRVTTTGPTRARAATTELGLELASSGFLRSQRYTVYELGLVNLEDLMAPDDGQFLKLNFQSRTNQINFLLGAGSNCFQQVQCFCCKTKIDQVGYSLKSEGRTWTMTSPKLTRFQNRRNFSSFLFSLFDVVVVVQPNDVVDYPTQSIFSLVVVCIVGYLLQVECNKVGRSGPLKSYLRNDVTGPIEIHFGYFYGVPSRAPERHLIGTFL